MEEKEARKFCSDIIVKAMGPGLRKPNLPRKGESIGGGFIVYRRGSFTKRVKAVRFPFEYASMEEAQKGIEKLKAKGVQGDFEIWGRINEV